MIRLDRDGDFVRIAYNAATERPRRLRRDRLDEDLSALIEDL